MQIIHGHAARLICSFIFSWFGLVLFCLASAGKRMCGVDVSVDNITLSL